jgi:hypothetical protein
MGAVEILVTQKPDCRPRVDEPPGHLVRRSKVSDTKGGLLSPDTPTRHPQYLQLV